MNGATGIPEVKLCINCEHLLGKRMHTDCAGAWRCHHPSNVLSNTTDLVTGAQVLTYVASSLYDCRSSLGICGVEGKHYKRYIIPDYPATCLMAATTRPAKPKLEDLI